MNAKKMATGLQEALKMTDVPPEKWHQILRRVVFGVLLCALAFYGDRREWSPWLTGPLWAAGGFNISRQLATQTRDFVLDLLKRVIGLIALKNGKEPPADA